MRQIHVIVIGAAIITALAASCGPSNHLPVQKDPRDEVVSDGYGEISKGSTTTAIQRVSPDERELESYNNIIDYLRGRVPGLSIGYSDGVGMPEITIRGKNSINASTQPLFVVDGAQFDDIMWVNPHDIATVDVIKDGSAAMYGVRGANGVIIITTKTGKESSEAERAEKKAERAARASERSARAAERAARKSGKTSRGD